MLTHKTGGFVTLRHAEIIIITADMLLMEFKDVWKKSTLSTTPNSNDELQADISMCTFLAKITKDICWCKRVLFCPFAPSYQNQSLNQKKKKKENATSEC